MHSSGTIFYTQKRLQRVQLLPVARLWGPRGHFTKPQTARTDRTTLHSSPRLSALAISCQ
ncbi:hypothetical protein AKJ16_DCAP03493 [Drosera capensis]